MINLFHFNRMAGPSGGPSITAHALVPGHGSLNELEQRLITIPSEILRRLLDRVESLTALVQDIHAREAAKPEIDPKARYLLDFAAEYLGASTSTLKRRAAIGKLALLYDGKKPFVTGAELLRYAREGSRRGLHRKRKP